MLAIVAEQTGYPEDLLDMDLDLEADLGIDTVKQAEVFATIREAYGIERDDTLKLRDYPTLTTSSASCASGRRRRRPPSPSPSPSRRPRLSPEPAADFPRRVPVPVLRPPLERCVETGVRLGEGSACARRPRQRRRRHRARPSDSRSSASRS